MSHELVGRRAPGVHRFGPASAVARPFAPIRGHVSIPMVIVLAASTASVAISWPCSSVRLGCSATFVVSALNHRTLSAPPHWRSTLERGNHGRISPSLGRAPPVSARSSHVVSGCFLWHGRRRCGRRGTCLLCVQRQRPRRQDREWSEPGRPPAMTLRGEPDRTEIRVS